MNNLQKAILQNASNKENMQQNMPTAKKVKTKKSDTKENENKTEFEIKNDLSNLCVIAHKGIDGDEYLMINMNQISLFDTIYQKQIDTLNISGRKYTIFDVPSDNSCCFHTLSLVLSYFTDLKPKEYMHGLNLRKYLAITMSHLLRDKVKWIIDAFSVLTDCKTRKDRSKYISQLRNERTWGQRLEILVFCYLYNCELFIATTSEDNKFKFESTTKLFNEYLTHKPKFDIKRTSYIASVHARDILLIDNKPKNHYVFLKQKSSVIFHKNIPNRVKIKKLNTLNSHTIGKAKEAFDKAISNRQKADAKARKLLSIEKRKNRIYKPNIASTKLKRIEKSNAKKNCPADINILDYQNIKKIWIELEGKLHEKLPIAKCMKNFQDDISKIHLELPKPCIRCGRAWFSEEINQHEEICNICLNDDGTFCNECALHYFDDDFKQCAVCDANQELGNPNLFSVFNHMQVGPPVPEVADLFQEELSLISICIPMVRVFRKTGNRFGYKDHCICLPQAINKLCSLPRPLGNMSIMWMLREGKNDTFKRVKIRRKKVETALKWLIKHNPLYKDFEINWDNLATLPEEDVDIKDIPKMTIDNDTFAEFDDQPLDEDIINEYDKDIKISESSDIPESIISEDEDTEFEDDHNSSTCTPYNADNDSLYMSDEEPSEHEYIPNQTLNNEDEKQFEIFGLQNTNLNHLIASSDSESESDNINTNDTYINMKRKHMSINVKNIDHSTKKVKLSYPPFTNI